MSQVVSASPTTDGGRIDDKVQAAVNFGGGEAVGSRRFGREQLAQEWFHSPGPVSGMIAAGGAWRPEFQTGVGGGVEVVAVQLIESGAAQAEFFGGRSGGDLVAAKGGEDFTDQRSSEAMDKLAIVFFIAASMAEWSRFGERGALALRAFRRPSLRSGLLQARRARSVHVCSHTTVHL